MNRTHLHRAPLTPAAPSAGDRLRGAVGATALSILIGVLVAGLFALVVAVLAVLAITTLG